MKASQVNKEVPNDNGAVVGIADAEKQLKLNPDAKEFDPRKGGFSSNVSDQSCTVRPSEAFWENRTKRSKRPFF